jgi:hypothetical protein
MNSNFKQKNSKKIINEKKIQPQLDGKHESFINEFTENESSYLPKIIEERKELYNKFMDSSSNIEEKINIKEKINKIDSEIKEIKKKKKDYFLNNSEYIFDYFENKKKISECNNKTKVLDTFFNIKKPEVNDYEAKTTTDIQKYFYNVDNKLLDVNNFVYSTDICNYCNTGEMIPIDHEGILVCNNCSKYIKFLVDIDKPTYKEPPKEVCFYAYKRINHFREILAQFQAKETTLIPNQVLEDVKFQIKKERITIEQLTNKKAKEILKKLGYNKYYEHIPFIKDKLGIKPPIMTPELEERLCNLFIDIQGPYSKFCPEDRVNFLNYYYTVYKLCELLEQRQFLPYFPMLKDKVKRIEQDEIWKKICEELNWTFIPTV